MRLAEDDRGLPVEASLDAGYPDLQSLQAQDGARGDLDGRMSFAFTADQEQWNEERTERTLQAVTLQRGAVSIVKHSANPATSATTRQALTA